MATPTKEPRRRTYRSTTLNLASKHCARAVDFSEEGVPYERNVFQVGVAAHAILQALGTATKRENRKLTETETLAISDATCRALIEFGRREEGYSEPPLAPDHVFAGRDLALSWLIWHDLSPTAHYEIGLAVDADWNPVPWRDPRVRFRGILDVLDSGAIEDEETSAGLLLIRDYKSAWSADASELDTVQRRSQVLLAYAHRGVFADVGEPGAIRTEIGNLRMGKLFEDTIVLDDAGLALLAQWRRDVSSTMDALDAQRPTLDGRRPASPGAGCYGCPFIHACDDAHDYLENTRVPGTAERRSIQYAIACSLKDRLADMLRADSAEGPIEIPNGVVGTIAKQQRALTDEGPMKLADEWALQAGGDAETVEPWLRGFARAADLGVTNAEKVCRKLFPGRSDKAERDRFLAEITEQRIERRFGVWPAKDVPATMAETKTEGL